MRASRVETPVPGIIEGDLSDAFTPLRYVINSLTTRIEVCERGQGVVHEVMTLKTRMVMLRKDVDKLKSTDMLMILRTVDI